MQPLKSWCSTLSHRRLRIGATPGPKTGAKRCNVAFRIHLREAYNAGSHKIGSGLGRSTLYFQKFCCRLPHCWSIKLYSYGRCPVILNLTIRSLSDSSVDDSLALLRIQIMSSPRNCGTTFSIVPSDLSGGGQHAG